MDGLNQQINQILSDPRSMQQIQEMATALGLGGNAAPAPPPAAQNPPQDRSGQTGGLDPSALMGMLNSLGLAGAQSGGQQAPSSPPARNPAGGFGSPQSSAFGGITPEMLQMVSRLAPLIGQINREDDSTRLLHALRPLLSPARQSKLDEAVKILQMMRLLPLLKENGLISGLLPGVL